MKIKNFNISLKEERPRKTLATIFKIEDLNFAVANWEKGKKNLYIYHFETGVSVRRASDQTHQQATEEFKDWAINRNEGVLEKIRKTLAEKSYPTLNKMEEIREKKDPRPRKKPTFFVKTTKDLFTLEYSKKFEFDGENYVLSKECLAPHDLKPSNCPGWVVYHLGSGRIASSGENSMKKAVEVFKGKFNNFTEDQKNSFRQNLGKLEIINN